MTTGSELFIDNFAGGGGASTGIEMAIGRSVDIAINHDPDAIAMHKANHPKSKHYCEDVWEVDPVEACAGRPVALAWFSPDCKHFSRAKGGKPVDKNIRGLAWVAVRWAATVKPRVIMLENVEEFKTWGPLTKDGYPDPDKKGHTFNAFVNALKQQGYQVDFRELRACDYGAPTSRKRFFMVARRDGMPIRWPQPTHADPKLNSKLKPWRTASEIIDWSLPCPSIFERKRPLVENTMKRIARGIQKFVVDNPGPFIMQAFGGGYKGAGSSIHRPLPTITAKDHNYLVTPFLQQYHSYASGGARGQPMDRPLLTLDTSNRYALVKVFLIKYYGTGIGSKLTEPLPTIVSKDRFGLVVVGGINYQISDIGMRMLEPRELFNAQGFPPDYIIDRDFNGKQYPKSAQVARCGNAVPPAFAEALIRVNLPDLCMRKGMVV